MLTVIFGAGASYDSEPTTSKVPTDTRDYPTASHHRNERIKWRPPLTAHLFDERRTWVLNDALPSSILPIFHRLARDSEQTTLEEALENLLAELEIDPKRWPQILGVQEWLVTVITKCTKEWGALLKGNTGYVDLLERLRHWQVKSNSGVNLITFNYDTLLEDAYQIVHQSSETFSDFDDYVGGSTKIFKPHGSVNWWYKFTFDNSRRKVTERPLSNREVAAKTLHLGPRNPGIQKTGGRHFSTLPAVAVPVVNKKSSDFVLPPTHMELMTRALENTTALLTIGWAGAEQHFMQHLNSLMASHTPTLVVCGGAMRDRHSAPMSDEKGNRRHHGDTTLQNLSTLGGLTNITDTKLGFSQFLNNRSALEEWLDTVPKD